MKKILVILGFQNNWKETQTRRSAEGQKMVCLEKKKLCFWKKDVSSFVCYKPDIDTIRHVSCFQHVIDEMAQKCSNQKKTSKGQRVWNLKENKKL